MKKELFETKMRRGEMYHNLRVLDGNFVVMRMDGRGFSKLTKARGFVKPFDPEFNGHMLKATEAVTREFGGLIGYTESDEISVLLPASSDHFDREVEKLVSLAASVTSVAFSVASGITAHFDARLWVGSGVQDVVDYFSWRMADAERNSLQGSAYWALRQRGLSRRQATQRCHGQGKAGLHELLHSLGLNWNNLATWEKRGVAIRRIGTTREGYDPVKKEVVQVQRSSLEIDWDLPYGDEYREMIRKIASGEVP